MAGIQLYNYFVLFRQINPHSTIIVSYEGNMLEFVTLTPGSIRAGDLIDYYSQPESINKPLELWHKNQKLDEDRLVGRMKCLTLKDAAVPAHHQLSSPGKPCSPEPLHFLSP